jgi:DNA-binding MarR family transcriptional regulator
MSSAAPTASNVGFLLAKATQRWNELLAEGFRAEGFAEVRPSYGSVLLPLWESDGLRMGELATRARLRKQTMTTLVRLAERDGLVRREPDPHDGRVTRVWLTRRAQDFGPVARRVVDQLHARVEAVLGGRSSRTLERCLTMLMDLEGERP